MNAWVNGGSIPIAPASKYLGHRDGIYTPDEVAVVGTWGVNGSAEQALVAATKSLGLSHVRFKGITFDTGSELIPVDDASVSCEERDSLILSFSKSLSAELATRLGKKAIVEIVNTKGLADAVESQVGAPTKLERVLYTRSPLRDCFLKSIEDQWQHEVRMAWFPAEVRERWIELPAGIAVEIPFEMLPLTATPPDCLLEADYDRHRAALDHFWRQVHEWNHYHYQREKAEQSQPETAAFSSADPPVRGPVFMVMPPSRSEPGNRKERRRRAREYRRARKDLK